LGIIDEQIIFHPSSFIQKGDEVVIIFLFEKKSSEWGGFSDFLCLPLPVHALILLV